MTGGDRARVVNATVCGLGEGPIWDPVRQELLWVDIHRDLVFRAALAADGGVTVLDEIEFEHGASAVAVAPSGDWLVAGATHLWKRTSDARVERGIRLLPPGSGRRLNDGKADPAGDFVVGSLQDVGESATEFLSRVSGDGRVTAIDSDLTLSNGMAWSRDGRLFYSVDTLRRTVFVRPYDPETGRTGERKVFITVDHGYPDGLCLDADEHLWVALWGLGRVHRYSPSGALVRIVDVAAPHVSSVAFAGPLLDTLVITTATEDLSDEQRMRFPDSGRLFAVDPEVPGLPQRLWNGRFAGTGSRT